MQRVLIDHCPAGLQLARPVPAEGGGVLLPAGTPLDSSACQRLHSHGVHEVLALPVGAPIPDVSIPAYMDRYGDDFAPRLHHVFRNAMVDRSMQELFLKALAHASHCYRRYRLGSEP